MRAICRPGGCCYLRFFDGRSIDVRMRARRVFIAFFTPGWLYSSVRTPFSSSRSMVENNSGWSSAGSPSSSVWRLSSSSSLDLGNEVCYSQGHRLCLSDSDVPVGDDVTLLGFLRGILAFFRFTRLVTALRISTCFLRASVRAASAAATSASI